MVIHLPVMIPALSGDADILLCRNLAFHLILHLVTHYNPSWRNIRVTKLSVRFCTPALPTSLFTKCEASNSLTFLLKYVIGKLYNP